MNKKIALICSFVVIVGLVIALLFMNKKEYEVVFDTNGGSLVETQIVKKSDTITKPNDPTKDGYSFDNWYLDDEIFDFETPITNNITLVAKWIIKEEPVEKKEYTVKFDSNGGSKVSSIKVEENSKITKPTTPTRNGYKFVSWQLNEKAFDFDTKITSNITLVAKWEKITSNNNNSSSNNNKINTIEVKNVKLSKTNLALKVGENSTLTVEIDPNNATNKNTTWTSSNTSVATVDKNGLVVAKGKGTATITVKVGNKEATCTVTVEEPITYSIVWEEVKNSSIGQEIVYIRSSEGTNVSGIITITTIGGQSSDVEITNEGKMYIRSAIEKVEIKSVK